MSESRDVKTSLEGDWALADSVTQTADGLRLRGSGCPACGTRNFPAQRICGTCWSEALEPAYFGPTGTLYTYTVIHQSRPGWVTPYVLGFVDLPEGIRVSAPIDAPDGVAIEIGASVRLGTRLLRDGPGQSRLYSHCFTIEPEKTP